MANLFNLIELNLLAVFFIISVLKMPGSFAKGLFSAVNVFCLMLSFWRDFIYWVAAYLVDNAMHPLNKRGQFPNS